MVIGSTNDTNLIEDKKSSPIPSESVEKVSSTPFRPMFKKKADRTESESTEIPQSQSVSSKRKEKDHVTRVSLSFEDESTNSSSVKRIQASSHEAKYSENDNS